MSQSSIMAHLDELYDVNKFSVGLHTTVNRESAESICRIGLQERAARAIEGTLSIKGDFRNFMPEDLNFFFPYTNYTVIVAIPSQFEAERINDNKGGNDPQCEFSRFIKFTRFNKKQFPEFTTDSCKTIPSSFIVGYFDKDYTFYPNPECQVGNSDFGKYVDDLKNKYVDLLKKTPAWLL